MVGALHSLPSGYPASILVCSHDLSLQHAGMLAGVICGTAVALQTIITTLLGVGIGPLLTGLLSDVLHPMFGIESLRYALLLVSLPVVGAVYLLFRSSRHAAATSYGQVPEAAIGPTTQHLS